MNTNNSNQHQKDVEVIQIDDTDNDTPKVSPQKPTGATSNDDDDIEIIEDIVRYMYEKKVSAKRQEILKKKRGEYIKDSGVYFEHYLGCIETDSIILSSELKNVKSDKDINLCCEISPKSTKRSYAAMYSLVLNENYVMSNDYIKIRSKHYAIKENPKKIAKKVTSKRKGSSGSVTDSLSSTDSSDSYIYERYVTLDKKYEEYYKCKNDIFKDIYNGGNACIRLKHNETDIAKFKNDLSRTLSVFLILNAIRIEVDFEKLPLEEFKMAGNLKTYVHVILYPDAFNIDLHKFQEGCHPLIKNSVIKLFEGLKMWPVREAKLNQIKESETISRKHNKIEITTRSGNTIKTVAIKGKDTNRAPSSISFGFNTPHNVLGNTTLSPLKKFNENVATDESVLDISSDSEMDEAKAEAEIATNAVFFEEKYRGGLPIEEFKEIHPNSNYFKPVLKPYQAEGVWWMYFKENPPEYSIDKLYPTPDVKTPQNNNNKLSVNIKSENINDKIDATDELKRKNVSKEIRNKPLNPVWAEYIFEPSLQIYEKDKLKCVLKYFYVNKSNGIMSLCFPEYTPPYRGGILSDEMGLGKTIQSIGLIIHDICDNNLHKGNNKEECKADDAYLIESAIQGCDYKKGGTLVVAPLALLYQWKEEIERHTRDDFISFYVYYAEEKCIMSEELAKYTVVLTTYSTLASEYKNNLRQEETLSKKKKNGKDNINENTLNKSGQQRLNNFFMKTKLATLYSNNDSGTDIKSPIVKNEGYDVTKQRDGSGTSRNKSGILRWDYDTTDKKYQMKKEASLYKIIWRRVMVDEAHVIKNKNTTQSSAVWKLRGERKWCITGTPIQNSVADIFPLLRFIGVKPYGNYDWWNREVGEHLKVKERFSTAVNIVREIASPILLRRTKNSKAKDGKCIITLPQKNIHIEKLQFTEEEKDFYQAVYYRSKTKFETYISEGNIMSHYTHVLQLLLRLRQCCSHPLLLFSKPFFEEWNKEDQMQNNQFQSYSETTQETEKMANDIQVKNENMPLKISTTFQGKNNMLIKQEKTEVSNETYKSNKAILYRLLKNSTTSHKVDASYMEELENLKKGSLNIECIICTEDAISPLITKCMHIICKKCAQAFFHLTHVAEKPCPQCGHYINLKSLKTLDKNVSPIDDLLRNMTKDNFIYSTKLKRLFEYVQEDMKKELHVVVFSQWVGYLKIISKLLTLHDIPNKTYEGSLNYVNRKGVLDWFNIQRGKVYTPGVGFVEPKEKIPVENFSGKVLLCSLKAGGVGLNLTVASKLYLMDLWWNPAIEDQAYQRVHRIGQLKNVDIYKFVIEKTVEKRILDLHETKNTTANEILTQQGNMLEATEQVLPQKLSVQNLIDMFKDYNREGIDWEETSVL